jgi:TRAP-type mannitol/chloroaromatic compound transport system permease large subunit
MVPVVALLPISLDINLVWFGILLVVATEISLITPPVGMNVFVLNILKTARPDWQFSTYRAYVREYPDRVAACDGYVISGSPASINAQDGWIG